MQQALTFIAVVLACNLAPAFAPPTWTIIVFFSFNSEIPLWLLIGLGALAAASGRYGLARYTSYFREFISKRTVENLLAAGRYFEKKRKYLFLALAALSPVPSAQLFEAAGLMNLELKKLTIAFFSGRLISYSIYAAGARSLSNQSFAESFVQHLKSPWGIALQVVMIGAIVLISQIDWKKIDRSNP